MLVRLDRVRRLQPRLYIIIPPDPPGPPREPLAHEELVDELCVAAVSAGRATLRSLLVDKRIEDAVRVRVDKVCDRWGQSDHPLVHVQYLDDVSACSRGMTTRCRVDWYQRARRFRSRLPHLESAPGPKLERVANVDHETAGARRDVDPVVASAHLQARHAVLEEEGDGAIVGVCAGANVRAGLSTVQGETSPRVVAAQRGGRVVEESEAVVPGGQSGQSHPTDSPRCCLTR
jgi:hypothetical protein